MPSVFQRMVHRRKPRPQNYKCTVLFQFLKQYNYVDCGLWLENVETIDENVHDIDKIHIATKTISYPKSAILLSVNILPEEFVNVIIRLGSFLIPFLCLHTNVFNC